MIDPNEPAYPSHGTMGEVVHTGMTIRAEIASRIMAGIASRESTGERAMNYIVSEAVELADALIAELNKEPT